MKRVLVISALALSLVSLGFRQGVIASAREEKEKQPQGSTTKQVQNEAKLSAPVDMDGKPISSRDTCVASRTLSDGRVVAYRKNKREIKALVKALKEDGQTDEKLLNPQIWLLPGCSLNVFTKQCHGTCNQGTCTYTKWDCNPTRIGKVPYSVNYGYCFCFALVRTPSLTALGSKKSNSVSSNVVTPVTPEGLHDCVS
jgi:hypothetical protein